MPLEPVRDHDLERPRSRALEVSFQLHAVTYLLVNLMLIGIWAAVGGGVAFWPIFPILGWAPAVGIHGWITYGRLRD
jgi:fatty acid desaturase